MILRRQFEDLRIVFGKKGVRDLGLHDQPVIDGAIIGPEPMKSPSKAMWMD
jgi:hypothetical protein